MIAALTAAGYSRTSADGRMSFLAPAVHPHRPGPVHAHRSPRTGHRAGGAAMTRGRASRVDASRPSAGEATPSRSAWSGIEETGEDGQPGPVPAVGPARP